MGKDIQLTIGMDVGDTYSHLVVLDDRRAVVQRERITTKAASIRTWFGRRSKSRVALEVGRHSPWISRLLAEVGHEVIVGNPRKIALIHGDTDKSDPIDAEKLARLARVDPSLLSPIQHRRADTQAALAIVRSRDVLVRARSKLINSGRGQVKAAGGSLRAGSPETFHLREDELPEFFESGLSPLMAAAGELTARIRHYDKVIAELYRDVYPETPAALRGRRRRSNHRRHLRAHHRRSPRGSPRTAPSAATWACAPSAISRATSTSSSASPRPGTRCSAASWSSAHGISSGPSASPATCAASVRSSSLAAARPRTAGPSSPWPAASPSCCTASG